MSETTSVLIQGGALAVLFAFMAFSIRYLAQELKTVRFQLQALENRLLTGAGLPASLPGMPPLPPPPPPGHRLLTGAGLPTVPPPGQGEPLQ